MLLGRISRGEGGPKKNYDLVNGDGEEFKVFGNYIPVFRIRRIRDFSATRIRILKEQNIDQNHPKIILKFSKRRLFLFVVKTV